MLSVLSLFGLSSTLPANFFAKFVTSLDSLGNVLLQTKANVGRYKYLAHSREVTTEGMAGADVQEDGLLHVAVAYRADH